MDNSPVILTMHFNAPVSKVWEALTHKEKMKEWYFDVQDYTLAEGSTFHFYEPGGSSYLHQCRILEVNPEKRFSHTWAYPDFSSGETTLSWDLEAEGNGTRLTLTHADIDNLASAGEAFSKASFAEGWKGFELGLRHFLDRPDGLGTLTFSTNINSSPEKIWGLMWDAAGYSQWTKPFNPGSSMSGTLEQGGRVHFLSAEGDGMYSNVDTYVPNFYVAFKHIGTLKDFKEQPVDEATKKWSGCIETYTLYPNGKGGSTLNVKVDVDPAHYNMMNDAFPKSLQVLKEMSEQ
jgi:uncharacterized protein YndB with AHSA1/START domain